MKFLFLLIIILFLLISSPISAHIQIIPVIRAARNIKAWLPRPLLLTKKGVAHLKVIIFIVCVI